MVFSRYNFQFIPRFFSRCFSLCRSQSPEGPAHVKLQDNYLKKFSEIFIIGDVHGCFDELRELLEKINNNNKILKIFVGDLVNKGPKSSEVLTFMLKNKDTCISVRGNHDEFVYSCYLDKDLRAAKKMFWVEELSEEQIDYIESLPYTISIPSLNCVIVHAGLLPGKPLEEQLSYDLLNMRNVVDDSLKGLTGSKFGNTGHAWAKVWKGPQHVYFGHDAARKLQNEENATGLDTGAVYGNQLTGLFIYGPRKGEYFSVDSKVYKPIT